MPENLDAFEAADIAAEQAQQAKVAAVLTRVQKDVGIKTTISDVQRKRKIASAACVIDEEGNYSIIASYQEWLADGEGVVIGPVESRAMRIDEDAIDENAKAEIDAIFARVLPLL